MTDSFTQWLKDGKHLPEWMRDFSAQGRLFRRLDEIVEADAASDRPHKHIDMPDAVTAHIYVIDFFLWYMARRGYTLQRCRAKQPFINLEDDLAEFDKREHEHWMQEMKAMMSEKVTK